MASSSFWKTFNSEDSFLPLYIPLILWIATYLFCKAKKIDFARWYTLHNFHNLGAIALGLISLYYNDDAVFNERIPILWSIGYFIVDLYDCVLRLDWVYTLHAAFCLVLGVSNYATPVCRQLRMNSKATLCEVSNPVMHIAKKTRNPWHFGIFAILYTACRIVWLPILMQQLLAENMPPTDPRFVCLVAFYGLNLFWYYKILRILVNGLFGEKKTNDKEA